MISLFSWFNNKKSHDNDEDKIYTGGNNMIHQAIGEFECKNCSHINVNPRMMEISDDDIHGSLIECSSEQCKGSWRQWVY